ncbi:hypothetical protein [Streptomyces sp. NPDC060366]|uniref:hypothetical protein n=1 Tax=Streptomyces sp. NPDC060366 TaxID=3347105 RepID=UPI00364E6E53
MTAPTTTAIPVQSPTACLLHADVHVMDADCWAAVLNWQAANDHLEPHEAHDAYQAAVERRMLNQVTRQHAPA